MIKKRTWEEKKALIAEYEASDENISEFCKRHKLNSNAIYNWRYTCNMKNKKVTPIKSTDTRTKLYNELAEEYKTLEAKLKVLHRRMTLLGEEW